MAINKIELDGKTYILVPEEAYNEYKPERARTGYERVRVGDEYFSNLFPKGARKCNDNSDSSAYACGDYANDKQLYADNERAIEIYRRMRQWQALNDDAVDYNRGLEKWYIYYDKTSGVLKTDYNRDYIITFCVYFSSEEKAEEAIEVFKDDLIWLHTQYRRRLDEVRNEQ